MHLRLNLARWLRAHAVTLAALVLISEGPGALRVTAVTVGSLRPGQAGRAIPAAPVRG